jgi:hypothetical protein
MRAQREAHHVCKRREHKQHLLFFDFLVSCLPLHAKRVETGVIPVRIDVRVEEQHRTERRHTSREAACRSGKKKKRTEKRTEKRTQTRDLNHEKEEVRTHRKKSEKTNALCLQKDNSDTYGNQVNMDKRVGRESLEKEDNDTSKVN